MFFCVYVELYITVKLVIVFIIRRIVMANIKALMKDVHFLFTERVVKGLRFGVWQLNTKDERSRMQVWEYLGTKK